MSRQPLFQPYVNGLITLSFFLYLKSEPFNGQGSLPGGGAGGYNAFTQAAVSGVGHILKCFPQWKPAVVESICWCSKHLCSSFLSQAEAAWCPGIPLHQWEGIQRLQWHPGHPCLPTCPQARTRNPRTCRQTSNPTSPANSPRQVRRQTHLGSTEDTRRKRRRNIWIECHVCHSSYFWLENSRQLLSSGSFQQGKGKTITVIHQLNVICCTFGGKKILSS